MFMYDVGFELRSLRPLLSVKLC